MKIAFDWHVRGESLDEFISNNRDLLCNKRMFYVVSSDADLNADATIEPVGTYELECINSPHWPPNLMGFVTHRHKIGVSTDGHSIRRLKSYITMWGKSKGNTGSSNCHGARIHFCAFTERRVGCRECRVNTTKVFLCETFIKDYFDKNYPEKVIDGSGKGAEHFYTPLELIKHAFESWYTYAETKSLPNWHQGTVIETCFPDLEHRFAKITAVRKYCKHPEREIFIQKWIMRHIPTHVRNNPNHIPGTVYCRTRMGDNRFNFPDKTEHFISVAELLDHTVNTW